MKIVKSRDLNVYVARSERLRSEVEILYSLSTRECCNMHTFVWRWERTFPERIEQKKLERFEKEDLKKKISLQSQSQVTDALPILLHSVTSEGIIPVLGSTKCFNSSRFSWWTTRWSSRQMGHGLPHKTPSITQSGRVSVGFENPRKLRLINLNTGSDGL